MRLSGLITVVLVIIASLTLGGSSSVAMQGSPSEVAQDARDDPRLFDLALAKAELDKIKNEVARLETTIVEALEEIDGLTVERDFIAMNDAARADVLAEAQGRARRMAINAYIGIGPPLSSIVLLDVETANDLSYRHSLLRQQAEILNEAIQTYSVLLGKADQNIIELSDYIDDVSKRIESANRNLRRETKKIPEAEWFVSIAEIHDLADREFAALGRVEPSAEQWKDLRFCESTETYNIDTGNTFFGAYQFTGETWETVHGTGNPADAPAEEQDARARLLFAQRGAQPWPICGRLLPR